MIKGVIFDFNGTLFWDTSLHNETWDKYLMQYDISLTDREKHLYLHGKNNRQIIEYLFGQDVSEKKILRICTEKELLYQKVVLKTQLQLADGVIDLFDFLKSEEIPFSIVTASDKLNVDFFIQYLKLEQWFKPELIIFNDGSMKGKPNPDMFLKAMELMGCSPAETVIFEDSETGIMAAHHAGPRKILIVDSATNDYSNWDYEVIKSFKEIDRTIFL